MTPWRPFHAVLPSGKTVDVELMISKNTDEVFFASLFSSCKWPENVRVEIFHVYQVLAIHTTKIILTAMYGNFDLNTHH